MKVFIDFDDVLFDTRSFYEGIKNIFLKNGISEELFKKYYRDPREKNEKGIIRKYNPRKQIQRIKAQGYEIGKIEKEFSRLVKNTKKYIFKDGVTFLKELRNEDLYIVSYGNKKFQKEKIINSGISGYFKKISIADNTKAIAIRKILKNKKIKTGDALIFIDDRAKFLRDIKKSYPGMVTFLMKRPEGRYDDKMTKYCDFETKNFSEILSIIKTKDGE